MRSFSRRRAGASPPFPCASFSTRWSATSNAESSRPAAGSLCPSAKTRPPVKPRRLPGPTRFSLRPSRASQACAASSSTSTKSTRSLPRGPTTPHPADPPRSGFRARSAHFPRLRRNDRLRPHDHPHTRREPTHRGRGTGALRRSVAKASHSRADSRGARRRPSSSGCVSLADPWQT